MVYINGVTAFGPFHSPLHLRRSHVVGRARVYSFPAVSFPLCECLWRVYGRQATEFFPFLAVMRSAAANALVRAQLVLFSGGNRSVLQAEREFVWAGSCECRLLWSQARVPVLSSREGRRARNQL